MATWKSVFTRYTADGEMSRSSQRFTAPTDADASAAAIQNALFWWRQNGGENGNTRVRTWAEPVTAENELWP